MNPGLRVGRTHRGAHPVGHDGGDALGRALESQLHESVDGLANLEQEGEAGLLGALDLELCRRADLLEDDAAWC